MTADTSEDLLQGVAAIGEFLQVKPRRVHHLIDKCGLPSFKIDGTVCSNREEIRKLITEQVQ